jgi:paraquat-inducible protein A
VPGAALFAFGALTLMLVLVLMFDPRTLWDFAEDIRARRATQPARTRGNWLPVAAPRGPWHKHRVTR